MFSVIPPVGVPFDWRTIFSDNDENGAFARSLAERLGGECTLVSSGKAALWLALSAMRQIRPNRTEVILPDYTCWTVPSAVVRAGLKVHPVDIEPLTLGLDPDKVQEAITEQTLAVIAPHLFGVPSEIEKLESICRNSGVFLIDDAAQAFGAAIGDRAVGSFGDAGILSFGRGKNVTTANGGAVITQNRDLKSKVAQIAGTEMPTALSSPKDSFQLLAYKLMFSRYLYWIPSSLPFLKLGETVYDINFELARMSADRAGRGVRQMGSYDHVLKARQRVAVGYRERLADAKGLNLIKLRSGAAGADLRFPVILADPTRRERILEEGKRFGISAMYPGTVSSILQLRDSLVSGEDHPVARLVCERLITLPTHFGISQVDIERISRFLIRAAS